MKAEEQTLEEKLTDIWALVDELGDLSVRLRRAADAAVNALGLDEEDKHEHS